MFKYIKNLIKKTRYKSLQYSQRSSRQPEHPHYPVPRALKDKTTTLGQIIGHSPDVIFRRFTLGFNRQEALAVYVDGLVNTEYQNESFFKPLMALELIGTGKASDYETIKNSLVNLGEINEHDCLWAASLTALSGDTLLLVEGTEKVLSVNTRGLPERGIEEPKRETGVRGPHEGFVENFRTSIAQLRIRLKSPDLTFETMRGGTHTNTDVAFCYMKGIANPGIVEEVKHRLRRITHTDNILESGNIEELIEDNPHSPFPQLEITERPDKAVSQLLEGRVIIFTDTTPFVLIAPSLFWQFIQSSDDYYQRWMGSFVRVIRIIALFVALFLPSVYVAISSYHQEMLPFALILSVASVREGIPFPVFVEAFLMEVVFEFLREAGIRLPMQIGQAVTIIGALLIGEAAIMANLVSPAMLIIVASTGIASFLIPAFNLAITLRLLRFGIIIMAGLLGLFGVMIAFMLLLTHLVSLRSFGVPYMSPLAPLNLRDLKNVLIRMPRWKEDKRPHSSRTRDTRRQDTDLQPGPEN